MSSLSFKQMYVRRLAVWTLAGIVSGIIFTDAVDQMRSGVQAVHAAVVDTPCTPKTYNCPPAKMVATGLRISVKLANILHRA